jgi:archaellum component FlaC
MSVADFFDLKFTLKKMIEDALGPILERLEIISERLNDMEIRVDLNRQEIQNLRTDFSNLSNDYNGFKSITNETLQVLNTQINTIGGNVNNLTTRVNNIETTMNQRFNDFELNIVWLRDRLQELSNQALKKAQPLPGYNPYNLGGDVTAQVWLYDITPVDDSDIRMYYIQFNNITGPVAHTTNWMPLPRAFQKYIYALHHEFYSVGSFLFTVPNLIGSDGFTTFRIEFSATRNELLLRFYAGPIPNTSGNYVGAIIIGNGRPSNTIDDIEKMKHEDLVKLTRELQLKVKELDKPKENIDKNKVMKDITEQMKRTLEYDFEIVKPPLIESKRK